MFDEQNMQLSQSWALELQKENILLKKKFAKLMNKVAEAIIILEENEPIIIDNIYVDALFHDEVNE